MKEENTPRLRHGIIIAFLPCPELQYTALEGNHPEELFI